MRIVTLLAFVMLGNVRAQQCRVGSSYRVWTEESEFVSSKSEREAAVSERQRYSKFVQSLDPRLFKLADLSTDCSDAATLIRLFYARIYKLPFQLIQRGIRIGHDGASVDFFEGSSIRSFQASIGSVSAYRENELDRLWKKDPVKAYKADIRFQKFALIVRQFVGAMMPFGYKVAPRDFTPGVVIASSDHSSTFVKIGHAPGASGKILETFSDWSVKKLEESYCSPYRLKSVSSGPVAMMWRTPVRRGTDTRNDPRGNGCWEYLKVTDEPLYDATSVRKVYSAQGTSIASALEKRFRQAYFNAIEGQGPKNLKTNNELELNLLGKTKELRAMELLERSARAILVDMEKRARMVEKGYLRNVRGPKSKYFGATSTKDTDKRIHQMFQLVDQFIASLARRFGMKLYFRAKGHYEAILNRSYICTPNRYGTKLQVYVSEFKKSLSVGDRAQMANPVSEFGKRWWLWKGVRRCFGSSSFVAPSFDELKRPKKSHDKSKKKYKYKNGRIYLNGKAPKIGPLRKVKKSKGH